MRPEHDPALPSGWLSVRDAADNLGISRQRLHALVKAGAVEAVRRGCFWVVSRYSLDEYATERGRPMSAAKLARCRAVYREAQRRRGAR